MISCDDCDIFHIRKMNRSIVSFACLYFYVLKWDMLFSARKHAIVLI